jgi:hypothetical protein
MYGACPYCGRPLQNFWDVCWCSQCTPRDAFWTLVALGIIAFLSVAILWI